MFRRLYEAAARLLSGRRADRTAVNDWAHSQETRTPDPYVWRLPSPYDARWRRWAKRSRATGHRLPFPCDEEYWTAPPSPPRGPLWETSDDVVRPYVLRP